MCLCGIGDSGNAFVFKCSRTTSTEQQKLNASDMGGGGFNTLSIQSLNQGATRLLVQTAKTTINRTADYPKETSSLTEDVLKPPTWFEAHAHHYATLKNNLPLMSMEVVDMYFRGFEEYHLSNVCAPMVKGMELARTSWDLTAASLARSIDTCTRWRQSEHKSGLKILHISFYMSLSYRDTKKHRD